MVPSPCVFVVAACDWATDGGLTSVVRSPSTCLYSYLLFDDAWIWLSDVRIRCSVRLMDSGSLLLKFFLPALRGYRFVPPLLPFCPRNAAPVLLRYEFLGVFSQICPRVVRRIACWIFGGQ